MAKDDNELTPGFLQTAIDKALAGDVPGVMDINKTIDGIQQERIHAEEIRLGYEVEEPQAEQASREAPRKLAGKELSFAEKELARREAVQKEVKSK